MEALSDNQQQPLTDGSEWFVMTSLDPKRMEELLLAENARRYTCGMMPFQYFIPYRFLKRRIADVNPIDGHEEDSFRNPKSRQAVQSNNEIRTALRRYIFIKSQESVLVDFLSADENKQRFSSLWFYLDKEKNRLKVPERKMNAFIESCNDVNLRFEIWPSLGDIEQNEEVVLNTTPFKGEKVRVLEVHKTSTGTSITVGFHLFSRDMVLRLPNLRNSDIIRQSASGDGVPSSVKDRMVENTQRRLLTVLSRRVKGQQADDVVRKDMATLDELFTYRHHPIADVAARRHFLALMLICAHLRHDRAACAELTAEVRQELAAIAQKSPEKAATDVRTYLQIALYIATGNPVYRTEAKNYLRDYNPDSEPLRRFVRLMKVKRIK